MKRIVGLLIVFLFAFSFVSADYLIYSDTLDEQIERDVQDCAQGENGSYIGMGTEYRVCEDESFCVYEYTTCEDGKQVDREESKTCVPCEYGCSLTGCYDEKTECNVGETCRLDKNSVVELEGGEIMGIVDITNPSRDLYKFNIDGVFKYIESNNMNKHELFTSSKSKAQYSIQLTKTRDEYVEFILESNEVECTGDEDCDQGPLIECKGNELRTAEFESYCSSNKCGKMNINVTAVTCDYKCENATCVECDGCLVDGECFSLGDVNDTHFCGADHQVLLKSDKQIYGNDPLKVGLKEKPSTVLESRLFIYLLLIIVSIAAVGLALFFALRSKPNEDVEGKLDYSDN